jgi:hypothetical protein
MAVKSPTDMNIRGRIGGRNPRPRGQYAAQSIKAAVMVVAVAMSMHDRTTSTSSSPRATSFLCKFYLRHGRRY